MHNSTDNSFVTILIPMFVGGFILAVVNLLLLSYFYRTLKIHDLKLWEELGEPSIFNPSACSNKKVLKYLFSNSTKPVLAHILKYLAIIFWTYFACYIVLFFSLQM